MQNNEIKNYLMKIENSVVGMVSNWGQWINQMPTNMKIYHENYLLLFIERNQIRYFGSRFGNNQHGIYVTI